jgi:hypothetical protein
MKKSKSRYFFRILFIFFVVYVALLIAYESGYYETKIGNKATLTKEAMEQFETDLENGEIVDVKNYITTEEKDYSNSITKVGNKLSNGISDIMTKGISGLFDTLKGLFW